MASLPAEMAAHGEHHAFSWGIAIVSTAFALFGILLAAVLYGFGSREHVPIGGIARPFYTLFYRKYFMDEIYENGIVGGALYRGLCAVCAWFDRTVVDGAVNGAGALARGAGALLRRLQTGSAQSYGLVLTGGAAVVVLVMFVSALR